MIKLSDFGLFDKPDAKPAEKRQYQAARRTKQNRGWTDAPQGANWILRCDLQALRARAREMSKNSPAFRKFLLMAKSNIVGHKGINLQCDAMFSASKKPYTNLNTRIEEAFWKWGKRETCTLTGKLSWVQAQQLAVETVIRDGECLVEHIVDADNEFGYAIKFWNVDWLDETHNEILKGGNRVIMGVELNADDRPVAYWLTEPPSENFYGYDSQKRRYRRRIDATCMSHIFLVTEDESQVRGVTWFHAALVQGKDLHEYASGVVKSARVASHTFGFLKQTAAEDMPYAGDPGQSPDQQQCQTDITINKEALSVNLLDPGLEFQQFDPKQPTQNHAEFMNSMLHVLGMSLGVPGFSIAGDMTQVNFSSARVGLNEEREVWRSLQEFIGDTFCRDIFRRWLTAAWLKGGVEMPAEYYKQLMEPTWRPRGWSYIDPVKDVQAAIDGIANNLLTYRQHFADHGIDLEEWLQSKQKEKALFAQYGIEYENQKQLAAKAKAAPPAAKELPPKPPQDDADEAETSGRYAN
jgi:lambda family phage portal protein